MPEDAKDFLDRLREATNAHDLDALVDCFTADYRNETPVHPTRGFTGQDQVRSNWRSIFDFVPDIVSTVLAYAVDGDSVWSEWEMAGTRRDGSRHRMRGVIVFGLAGGRAATARFYLEPVDEETSGIDEAVARQVHAETTA
jgi:ketosteroid isomerase-like protein